MVEPENSEKNITYELVDDKGELTEENKEKVLKLVGKIKAGKGIAEKFKKSSYNTRKILTTKIVREHEGRKETVTLLHHAMLHSNEKAINDIFEKAKEHQLFVRPEKACMFSGSKPHQDKSRSPVTRVAIWRETKMLKPTDSTIEG